MNRKEEKTNYIQAINMILLIMIFLSILIIGVFANHYLYNIGQKFSNIPTVESPVEYDIIMNSGTKLIFIDATGKLNGVTTP